MLRDDPSSRQDEKGNHTLGEGGVFDDLEKSGSLRDGQPGPKPYVDDQQGDSMPDVRGGTKREIIVVGYLVAAIVVFFLHALESEEKKEEQDCNGV